MINPVIQDFETEVLKGEFFYYLANLEIIRSMRYQDFASFLLLESDQGFDNGQDMKAFSHILREEFRITDIIGRVNHARFGVILPHADLKGAHSAGERIRERIENFFFNERQRRTISIGVACFPINISSIDIKTIISLAEEMLKAAKDDGGNKLYYKE
jgi:diguanylate cyclase (GGDEF)-like protein